MDEVPAESRPAGKKAKPKKLGRSFGTAKWEFPLTVLFLCWRFLE